MRSHFVPITISQNRADLAPFKPAGARIPAARRSASRIILDLGPELEIVEAG